MNDDEDDESDFIDDDEEDFSNHDESVNHDQDDFSNNDESEEQEQSSKLLADFQNEYGTAQFRDEYQNFVDWNSTVDRVPVNQVTAALQTTFD